MRDIKKDFADLDLLGYDDPSQGPSTGFLLNRDFTMGDCAELIKLGYAAQDAVALPLGQPDPHEPSWESAYYLEFQELIADEMFYDPLVVYQTRGRWWLCIS